MIVVNVKRNLFEMIVVNVKRNLVCTLFGNSILLTFLMFLSLVLLKMGPKLIKVREKTILRHQGQQLIQGTP